MIDDFMHWCRGQQAPYGFIIYVFVTTLTSILILTLLVYVAGTVPMLFLMLPVGFIIAVVFSLYKCLWANR